MNKKYSKPLLAAAISLSLMASTAQASLAGNGLKAAFNGVAVVGSAYAAYTSWGSFYNNGIKAKDPVVVIVGALLYTAYAKAAISGAQGLVEAVTNNADDGMEDEDGEE